jgi:hypothetical protein
MATTTNYSWTTPDDTALVKDGAAAIRSLGTAIDTTVFTNAGAAIAKAIVDAKGDIIAASAADTVARLAVGANDTVLTADSSTATGLKWAAPASNVFVGCLAQKSGSQTIANATQEKITFAATEIYDTDGFHSTVTDTSRMTIPSGKGGYYLIYAQVNWDASTAGRRIIYITKNNTSSLRAAEAFSVATNTQYPVSMISTVENLTAGDYVEIEVLQTSGGNLNTDNGILGHQFGVVKLG